MALSSTTFWFTSKGCPLYIALQFHSNYISFHTAEVATSSASFAIHLELYIHTSESKLVKTRKRKIRKRSRFQSLAFYFFAESPKKCLMVQLLLFYIIIPEENFPPLCSYLLLLKKFYQCKTFFLAFSYIFFYHESILEHFRRVFVVFLCPSCSAYSSSLQKENLRNLQN